MAEAFDHLLAEIAALQSETTVHAHGRFCMEEQIKYPPQFKIGFLSNNPSLYNLL